MFADAIEQISKFTKPVKFISRYYGSDEVIPGSATLFFVNENGVAITCKHVADDLLCCGQINDKYQRYKSELSDIPLDAEPGILESIESKYGYNPFVTVQLQSMLVDCVDIEESSIDISVIKHPKYDLAIIIIKNAKKNIYSDYAIFAKDSNKLRRGDFLCRYGYPFAEFSDYKYDGNVDDILWTENGNTNTPPFPIEGMITRNVVDDNGELYEYELSTPGLKGQSGGPLFDSKGIIYGMQTETTFLHLGFDQENVRVRINGQIKEVDNYPFLHVGRCITADVIKSFLNDNNIKYYVGDSAGNIEIINRDKAKTIESNVWTE